MAETKDKEEKKLGPNATYTPEDEEATTPVTVMGVQFTPGKATNVEDRLGNPEKAQEVLKKLSGNPAFKVDGGTDWKQAAEKKAKAEEQEAKDAEEARKKQAEKDAKDAGQTPNPPEDW
ncbi:MAG: hypothetical protein EHM13_11620, partial [Acidobacteria bacterium]